MTSKTESASGPSKQFIRFMLESHWPEYFGYDKRGVIMEKQAETVHSWIESFALGETKTLPSNVTAADAMSYGASRFGYSFKLDRYDSDKLTRVCPHCHR